MAKPTREDAQLLIQIAQLYAQSKVGKASRWVWSDEFVSDYDEFKSKYPRGSKEFGYVQRIAGFFETVGAIWKHGLIDGKLLFDAAGAAPSWERVKGILLGQREEAGEPALWENYEALAEAEEKAVWAPARRRSRKGK